MRAISSTRSVLAGLAIGVIVVGCSDDSPSPTDFNANSAPPASVTGSYHATTLILKEGNTTTNLLGEGAQITLVLTDSGTTSGDMLIPAAYSESGVEESVSLDGAYSYDAGSGTVMFDHVADTFIRDMTWNAGGTQLDGTLDTGVYMLNAILKRGD